MCKEIAVFYVVQCELYSQESSYEKDDTSPPVKKRRISSVKLHEENAAIKCHVEPRLTKELDEKRRCIDSLQQELTKLQTELSDNSLKEFS